MFNVNQWTCMNTYNHRMFLEIPKIAFQKKVKVEPVIKHFYHFSSVSTAFYALLEATKWNELSGQIILSLHVYRGEYKVEWSWVCDNYAEEWNTNNLINFKCPSTLFIAWLIVVSQAFYGTTFFIAVKIVKIWHGCHT